MFQGIRFFLKYSWRFQKSYVIYIILQQLVDSSVPLITIILPKFIIDELVGQKRIGYITYYIALLLGINFIGSLLSNMLKSKAFIKKNLLFSKFQIFLCEKIMLADYEKLEDASFLDLKERAYKFLYADGQGFGVVLDKAVSIIGKIVVFGGIITIISTINVFMVLLLVVLVLLTSFVNSKVKKANIELDMKKAPHERKNSYFLNLFSDFSYGKEIRIYRLNGMLINKYKEQLKQLNAFYKKSINNNQKGLVFASFMTVIQGIFSYGYLVYMILMNSITIGDFSMYLGAINTFSSAMNDVMESIMDIKRFGLYYDAVEAYIDTPKMLRLGSKLPDKENINIQFDNVSFKYPGQEVYALKNISITINSNEKLSVVGENGAGKTTFIKLLSRLYLPTEGRILLNGVDINEYDYDEYMNLFSTVFQDYKLFSFTLKQNISFSDESNDNDVETILIKSGLHNKLSQLPKGVHTSVYKNFDETGFEPSGGEGQKIALARALYKDAPIVILDEPTAALDPRAEYEIYKRFNELVDGKTAIYISHRLSSSRFCDKIAVFQNGNIVEYGSHEQLMKQNGQYAELFNMQAHFYVEECCAT